MTEAYPLSWPINWPRTKADARQRARFSTTFRVARDELLEEIRRLGGRLPVLSSNIRLNRDGLPYANFKEPEDPGVAVYFELEGKQQCFPCDKWNKAVDNMQAIRLTIGALRGIERWGSGEMMRATFQGFQALPAPEGYQPAEDYFKGLLNSEDLKIRYRELCMKLHPDKGGKAEEFAEMQRQYRAKGMSE